MTKFREQVICLHLPPIKRFLADVTMCCVFTDELGAPTVVTAVQVLFLCSTLRGVGGGGTPLAFFTAPPI
jgi:hypothetical protein